MPTNWHVMPSDWDDYTLDIKLLKHYQSIIGVLISYGQFQHCGVMWLTIFWTGVVHDKTNREACKSGIQSYGLPSGHTSLQDPIQHTGIPWITKHDICCMWCKFCRWSTHKEKSTRTLDFLQQWTYHMEEQPTTHDISIHKRGWTWQVCKLCHSKISTSYHEVIGQYGIPTT